MSNGNDRLIQAVLDAIAAEDPGDTQKLTDERLREVIFGRQPLTPQEQRLLVRSAATRDRLAWLRHLERARALVSWEAQAITPQPLQLLAAADATPAVAPLRFGRGEGYSVVLTPVDLEGREWHIALRIAPTLIAVTPSGFRLVDSEGLVWLSGHPDADGTIFGYWRRDEPLWQRVHKIRLELLPM